VNEDAGIADPGGRGLAKFDRIERGEIVAPEQLDIEAFGIPPDLARFVHGPWNR
jgi:hypothetical protein